MKIELAAPGLMLSANQVLALPEAQGACVTSESGTVWITQDGDPRDIVLQAGETACLEREATTLVQAFSPARIRIAEPRRSPRLTLLQRLRRWLRGPAQAWA